MSHSINPAASSINIPANTGPWDIAKKAQELKDSEMPRWQQVAINVGIATAGVLAILMVSSLVGVGITACFIASPVLGLSVAIVAGVVSFIGGACFFNWIVDQFIDSTDKGAGDEAVKIFASGQGPITDDMVDAFLSVEHLCEDISFGCHDEGFSDFDSFYTKLKQSNNTQFTQHGRQIIDNWIKGFGHPLDYNFIYFAVVVKQLMSWYSPPPILSPHEQIMSKYHEQAFKTAVKAGTYSDNHQGRLAFVMDALPKTYTKTSQTINYITVAQVQRIINGLGEQCTEIRIPWDMRQNPIVLQTLAAKGYTVDPQFDTYYCR